MGPRPGSPAAETRYDVFILLSAVLLGAGVWILPTSPTQAASKEVSHNVTVVVVQPALSFSEPEEVSLQFEGTEAGSESESQTVTYRLKSNNASTGSAEGILTATLHGPAEGIELRADPGSFANEGPAGGVILVESDPGFQTLADSIPVSLADKGPSLGYGTEGTILNGNLSVTWKAAATENLSSDEYPLAVTITLKES